MQKDDKSGWFKRLLMEKGVEMNQTQEEQFRRYYKRLIEWNDRMNLTSITNEIEVYEKHFYDSLTPTFHMPFKNEKRILDVGAGAGFPSFPIKILYPHISVVIIDSLQKRITFLQEMAKELQFTNVELIHGRAEDLGREKKYREKFPVVIARAVARMNLLLEYTLPLVSVNGIFIAMKGKNVRSELDEANGALVILGGKIERIEGERLPIEGSERNILWIRKENPTPDGYPRGAAVISKRPLV